LLELRRTNDGDQRYLWKKLVGLLGMRDLSMSDEYLTIGELGARLKLKPKTVKNKMAAGIWRKGVHYFSPPGLGPRFKWSAIVQWLEQSTEQTCPELEEAVPMARGYRLGAAHDCDS
jgi:hypothetical protein